MNTSTWKGLTQSVRLSLLSIHVYPNSTFFALLQWQCNQFKKENTFVKHSNPCSFTFDVTWCITKMVSGNTSTISTIYLHHLCHQELSIHPKVIGRREASWLPLRKASLSTSRKPPTIIKPHRQYSKHVSPSQTVPVVEKINMKEHKLFSSPQEKHFLSARSLSQMN